MKRNLLSLVIALWVGAGCAKPGTERMLYASDPPPDWDTRAGTAEPAGFSSGFDADRTGRLPAGWRIMETKPAGMPAVWSVVVDSAAASKPNVLALTETKNTRGTFNLAVAERTSFKDLDLSVKVLAKSGKEDQGGGPIWRCRDADNYYICRWNPLETNFRVYKVVGGKRQQLASADTNADAGQWHTIRVIMRGEHLECYLDGEKLLEGNDGAIKEAGMIGLWTKADAAGAFDDLSVKALD